MRSTVNQGISAMTWRRLFFSFRGRIDRETFSRLQRIVLGIAFIGSNLIIPSIAAILGFDQLRFLNVIVIVPLSAVVIKRLNDADRSRWLFILATLPFLAAASIAFTTYNISLDPTLWYFAWASVVGLVGAWLWVLVIIERLPSTTGANPFGPPLVAV
jgi:uncharacterized membrane protein YhaH (DUF805 family)